MSKLRIKKARTDYSPFYITPLLGEMVQDYIAKHGLEACKEFAKLIEEDNRIFNNKGNKLKRKIFEDLDINYSLYEKNYEMYENNKKYFPLKDSEDKSESGDE